MFCYLISFTYQIAQQWLIYFAFIHRTSHLAGVFGRELKTNITQPDIKITNKEILCLEVAGLCHDLGWYMFYDFPILADWTKRFHNVLYVDILGHGPFSHLFDQQFIRKARPNESWEVS